MFMKKGLYFLFFILCINSCQSIKSNPSCNENIKFKEVFFSHIKVIDNNIDKNQNEEFRTSLIFISNYAGIERGSLNNYSSSYPIGIYQSDRKKWIEWYELNKCRNIQFKETLVSPYW